MPRKNRQPTYEITIYNLGDTDNLVRSKLAIMDFDPSEDRYIQIEESIYYLFEKVGSYTVHLMKHNEIRHLEEVADNGLFGRRQMPNGTTSQLIEIGNNYWQY